VLVKASFGGGGRGMRLVRDIDELVAAVASAQREAASAFGADTVYLERYIDNPRHIEIQIVGDAHGNVVDLFERECSIQRRHQKVLEETPSTAVTPALRRRLGDAAVALARAAGYQNAGTVEFLLDAQGDDASFYFLEMNARLQVEHPITEAVTGVDLVRAQIEIAAGAALPWTQGALSQRGHAIELRIYAEDPRQGYLPQAGRLRLYREPSMPGVRIDSGVSEGDDIAVHYDPLLAKLGVCAETRAAARAWAVAALQAFPILGVPSNGELLMALLHHPRFIAGDIDTHFLDVEAQALSPPLPAEPPALVTAIAAAAGASSAHHPATRTIVDPWDVHRSDA
jgi:acetyl/propionyl-CoA carboxylase alpha subunit